MNNNGCSATDSLFVQVSTCNLNTSIGNFVWNDLNQDGKQDTSEPGLPGVVIYLQNCSGNNLDTTVTDSLGFYLFTDLITGNYKLTLDMVSIPAGFTISPQDIGTDDTLDSDFNPITGMTDCVAISVGENNITIDLGLNSQSPLACTTTGSSINCGGNNGTATVHVTGGIPPYNYYWNTNPPQSTATATGLAVGTYLVQVTDQSGSQLYILFCICSCIPVKFRCNFNEADSDWSILVYPIQLPEISTLVILLKKDRELQQKYGMRQQVE